MPSLTTAICFILLVAICGGLYLWWKSSDGPLREEDDTVPDTYTSENVRVGVSYHVEQDGAVQGFEVLSIHWSGFFLIRVEPAEGHELDRDHVGLGGWVRELSSSRLIEAGRLLEFLPPELRYAPSYN